MARKWVRRGVIWGGLLFLAAGIWAGSNWNGLQLKYAAHRLRAAVTDEERAIVMEHLPDVLSGFIERGKRLIMLDRILSGIVGREGQR